jgi:hypothetical protein
VQSLISRTDKTPDILGIEFLGHHNDIQSKQGLACPQKLTATHNVALGTLALNALSPTADGSMINTQLPAQRTVTLALLERAVQFFEDGAQ